MLKNKDLNFKALIQKRKIQSNSTMSQSLTHPHLYAIAYQNKHHHRLALIALSKSRHKPHPLTISLVRANKSSTSTSTPTRSTGTTNTTKKLERITKGFILIPTHSSSSSSSSGSLCFVPKKIMVVIDQHVLWTFFASLFGFVLLYIIRRNNNANNRKLKKKNSPQQCVDNNSFTDGEFRHVNGSDVIVVGAGVAGAALAYTLGKVHFQNKVLSFFTIFFFSYEILFLTVTCNLNNCNLYLSNLRILESVYLSCLLHKLYIILLLFLAKKSVMKFWSGGCVWKQMTQVQFSWEKNCLVWEVGL